MSLFRMRPFWSSKAHLGHMGQNHHMSTCTPKIGQFFKIRVFHQIQVRLAVDGPHRTAGHPQNTPRTRLPLAAAGCMAYIIMAYIVVANAPSRGSERKQTDRPQREISHMRLCSSSAHDASTHTTRNACNTLHTAATAPREQMSHRGHAAATANRCSRNTAPSCAETNKANLR